MTTTIRLDPAVRDRLRTYGTVGMTFNDILTRLMDEVDRREFVARIRADAARTTEWVDLEDE